MKYLSNITNRIGIAIAACAALPAFAHPGHGDDAGVTHVVAFIVGAVAAGVALRMSSAALRRRRTARSH
jgi:hypothetical protein